MNDANTIQKINAWEVVVPARVGAVDSDLLTLKPERKPWHHLPIILLEVTFADGVMGLGEVDRGYNINSIRADMEKLIGQGFADPRQSQVWQSGHPLRLDTRIPVEPFATENPLDVAMETVLLDATARRLDCRVVDLFGGPIRNRVEVDYWCGRQTPGDLEKTTKQAVSRGFQGLKMKSLLGDPVLKQVETICRIAGDDFTITIDPMFQWLTYANVSPILKQLESMGLHIKIEDPFPQDQPEMWRRVRETIGIPLVWHARDAVSLRRGLQEQICDGYNASEGLCWGFLRQAHEIEAVGMPCWHGSGLELGIAQIARLHAAAAAPACTLASDLVGPLIREHHLTDWDWPYEAGSLPLPERSGLGVKLNHAQLKKYVRSKTTIGSN